MTIQGDNTEFFRTTDVEGVEVVKAVVVDVVPFLGVRIASRRTRRRLPAAALRARAKEPW